MELPVYINSFKSRRTSSDDDDDDILWRFGQRPRFKPVPVPYSSNEKSLFQISSEKSAENHCVLIYILLRAPYSSGFPISSWPCCVSLVLFSNMQYIYTIYILVFISSRWTASQYIVGACDKYIWCFVINNYLFTYNTYNNCEWRSMMMAMLNQKKAIHKGRGDSECAYNVCLEIESNTKTAGKFVVLPANFVIAFNLSDILCVCVCSGISG